MKAMRAFQVADGYKLSKLREEMDRLLPKLKGSQIERLVYGTAFLHGLDAIDTAINAHYWLQTLDRDNVQVKLLHPWRREDTFIPTQGIRMSGRFFYANKFKFITGKVSNHDENIRKMKSFWQNGNNLSILSEEPLMIVSNHSGWQNLPYILALIQESLGCSLSRISTIIGPAVANLQVGREVAGMGNLITVIPATEHGRLPETLKDVEKKINQRAWTKLGDLAKNPGPAGPNIVIMCPFGTTDKRDEHGRIILNNKKGAKLAVLMAMRSGFNVLAVPTYDDGVLDGARLTGGKGRVNIGISKIYRTAGLKRKEQKEMTGQILEDIRAGIKDDNGKGLACFTD